MVDDGGDGMPIRRFGGFIGGWWWRRVSSGDVFVLTRIRMKGVDKVGGATYHRLISKCWVFGHRHCFRMFLVCTITI